MSRPLYAEYSAFLARYFSGKLQKLSVDAGFGCPNRDGTVGYGGCTYCNNRTFTPQYDERRRVGGEQQAGVLRPVADVAEQIEGGRKFFAHKYPDMRYLAYFQSFTGTYAPLDVLRSRYEEALRSEGVEGLVIGTRPDCVPDELLDYLAELRRRAFVLVEYGVESVCDATLRRIHRGHTFACAADAIRRTSARGIGVGVHLILGLPGETREDMLRQADVVSALPVDVLKLHQLQIVRHTAMAREYAEAPERFHLFSPEEYAELVADYLERLRPDITVERFTSQSPRDLLIAPDWGMKNYEFVELVKRALRARGTCQGCRYRTDGDKKTENEN